MEVGKEFACHADFMRELSEFQESTNAVFVKRTSTKNDNAELPFKKLLLKCKHSEVDADWLWLSVCIWMLS